MKKHFYFTIMILQKLEKNFKIFLNVQINNFSKTFSTHSMEFRGIP